MKSKNEILTPEEMKARRIAAEEQRKVDRENRKKLRKLNETTDPDVNKMKTAKAEVLDDQIRTSYFCCARVGHKPPSK